MSRVWGNVPHMQAMSYRRGQDARTGNSYRVLVMSRDALVIGINAYSYDRLPNLQAPAADAEAIAQLLEQYGEFKVTRLPAVQDKQNSTIRVGRKTQVALAQLEEAIVQLFKPEGRQVPDAALLYFSGHGLRKNRGIQEGFLATSDANPEAGNWGVSLQWLRRLLQESPVRQQIVVLDCCYGGEVLNIAEADPGERGKGRDRCFIAASRAFEVAYEGIESSTPGLNPERSRRVESERSVLTTALLEGLAPKQERWVSNYTLIDFLNQKQSVFPQRPIFANSGEPIHLTRHWKAPVEEAAEPRQGAICPYKGLTYFDCNEEDPKYFYGRTALTDVLLDEVRRGNFLAILGASGSGKSSVLRAGLLHQLKVGRRLSGSEAWAIRIFTPGEHPLQSLALAFLDGARSAIERATQLKQAEELLAEGATGLRRLVQASAAPRVVLAIDQFEEAFTLCRDEGERERFFACLLGIVGNPPKPPLARGASSGFPCFEGNRKGISLDSSSCSPLLKGGWGGFSRGDGENQATSKLCIIVAMRADFFGKCLEREYSGLAQQIQQHLVTVAPMTREELRQAIVAPAKRVELAVEPELVTQMLADVVGSPGSLPLLQYALLELWQRRGDTGLRLASYTQLGGVMGTLQKRATAVYEQFSEEEKAAAKHIFLSLTQLGEGTEDTRRRVLKQDLVTSRHWEGLIDAVVQKLADARLIVTQEVSSLNQKSQDLRTDATYRRGERPFAPTRGGSTVNLCKFKSEIPNPKSVVVDVAHEALIRHWILLRQWLNESRDNLREKRKIEAAAQEWRSRGKVKDYLLRGRRLREAKKFQKEQAESFPLSNLAERFIRTSIRFRLVNRVKLVSAGLVIPLIGTVFVGNELMLINHRRTIDECQGEQNCYRRILALEALNQAGRSLKNLNLEGANLTRANFREAYLTRANLTRANLREAYLVGADLTRANLIEADLGGADLMRADLRGANLREADLARANLRGAHLWEADLTGAYLWGADLTRADLRGANLREANLTRANLTGANLWGADLTRANLRGARNLTPDRVKVACNWQQATFSEEFRTKLNSSPAPKEEVDCSRWEE